MVSITKLLALPSEVANKSLQKSQADDALVVCFWSTNSSQSVAMMNSVRDARKANIKKWSKVKFSSICIEYGTKKEVNLAISTGAWDFDNYVCMDDDD